MTIRGWVGTVSALILALTTIGCGFGQRTPLPAQNNDLERMPSYIRMLCDADWTVRRNAACALGLMGPAAQDALPFLRRSLEDPSESVRDYAARAIRRIEPSAAPKDSSLGVAPSRKG